MYVNVNKIKHDMMFMQGAQVLPMHALSQLSIYSMGERSHGSLLASKEEIRKSDHCFWGSTKPCGQ